MQQVIDIINGRIAQWQSELANLSGDDEFYFKDYYRLNGAIAGAKVILDHIKYEKSAKETNDDHLADQYFERTEE